MPAGGLGCAHLGDGLDAELAYRAAAAEIRDRVDAADPRLSSVKAANT